MQTIWTHIIAGSGYTWLKAFDSVQPKNYLVSNVSIFNIEISTLAFGIFTNSTVPLAKRKKFLCPPLATLERRKSNETEQDKDQFKESVSHQISA